MSRDEAQFVVWTLANQQRSSLCTAVRLAVLAGWLFLVSDCIANVGAADVRYFDSVILAAFTSVAAAAVTSIVFLVQADARWRAQRVLESAST